MEAAKTPSSEMPVVYIVEAKKSDVDQGRAQLYPQMKEAWDHPVFNELLTLFYKILKHQNTLS
jgi:hypothetical protein